MPHGSIRRPGTPGRLVRAAISAALLLTAPATFLAPAAAQEAAGDEEMRALAAALATSDDPDRVWNDAARLAGYGPKATPFAAEAASSAEATAAGRVALGRVLLQLREGSRAAEVLLRAAQEPSSPMAVRVEAVRLLGQTTDDHEDAVRRILDEALDPRLRAACATSLWAMTKDADVKRALRELVRSDDFELRVEGALAMAEIGDFNPDVSAVLQQIRNEPTERGRLARALLEKDAWERVKTAAAAGAPAAPAGAAQSAGLPALLDEIQRTLKGVYVSPEEIDDAKLFEAAAHGIVSGVGDPHTTFQSVEERDDWADNLTKEYGGIGAYVGFDENGIFTITRPMFDGPAWKAGLKSGTRVLRIDDWDTAGHTVDDIVKRLRGTPDTPVRLLYQLPGWKDPQETVLTRRFIQVPTAFAEMLPGKVGYVLVDNFAKNTAEDFRKSLRQLERDGATALVLDLRFNTGGYLRTAQEMADVLLPAGKLVVETKGRKGVTRDEAYVSEGRGTAWTRSVPMHVLVNEFSASASEILSGALKAHGRAKVVGERTFGKGSVQNLFYLFTPPFAESFTDTNGNGAWDDREPFEDRNGNGTRDDGERFNDWNGNQRWDAAEPYEDRNTNGRFDAPALKITIAKYYVGTTPGSFTFNPSRREMFVAGRRTWLGGVEPDLPVASEELEGWRAEETGKLERSGAFERFIGPDGAHFEKHRETFLRLALEDTRNPSDHPGFDDWFRTLDTKLTREEVWFWLHLRLRNHASSALGRLLVGDWVVDQQLQRAIVDLAQGPGGAAAKSAPQYAFLFAKKFEVPPTYAPEAVANARPVKE